MKKADQMRIISTRFNVSPQAGWDWLKRVEMNDEIYTRRVNAALQATRTDFTQPEGGMREYLLAFHNVTLFEVASYFGYSESTLSAVVATGRFIDKRPQRAWTMIDYYLKENA